MAAELTAPCDADRVFNLSFGKIFEEAMAVPKRKSSNSRTGMRRAHDGLKRRELQACPQCSTAKPSHVVCPNCGYYMGRTVVQTDDE